MLVRVPNRSVVDLLPAHRTHALSWCTGPSPGLSSKLLLGGTWMPARRSCVTTTPGQNAGKTQNEPGTGQKGGEMVIDLHLQNQF